MRTAMGIYVGKTRRIPWRSKAALNGYENILASIVGLRTTAVSSMLIGLGQSRRF